MQLDENLLKDFASVFESSSEERDNYQIGTVLAVNGTELQVLMDKAIGDVRFAGYAFGTISLLDDDFFVTPHDGLHFIKTIDIANETIPVSPTKTLVYSDENSEWYKPMDPYTPDVGDLFTFIKPATTEGVQTVYQCVQNGSTVDGKYIMKRSFEVYNGLTPCTTYVKCIPGDKVAVRLMNNAAVVIGNLTSPAAAVRDINDTPGPGPTPTEQHGTLMAYAAVKPDDATSYTITGSTSKIVCDYIRSMFSSYTVLNQSYVDYDIITAVDPTEGDNTLFKFSNCRDVGRIEVDVTLTVTPASGTNTVSISGFDCGSADIAQMFPRSNMTGYSYLYAANTRTATFTAHYVMYPKEDHIISSATVLKVAPQIIMPKAALSLTLSPTVGCILYETRIYSK